MAFEKLFSLFNMAEDTLLNALKFLGPLLVLLLIFIIIKWIQEINKKTTPDIMVVRPPS
jgi:hypothetical protein